VILDIHERIRRSFLGELFSVDIDLGVMRYSLGIAECDNKTKLF